MTPGDGPGPAHADRAEAGPPPGDGRAETYLRLRAEAELRRALGLPPYEPPEPFDLPAPVRLAAGLARPAAAVIARVAEPMLPLGRRTADALRPFAENAARSVRPLADEAGRALSPAAGQAARRLQPLARQAFFRAQGLRYRAPHVLREWRWRAAGSVAAVRRAGAGAGPVPAEPSAEDGLHQLRIVARALAQAGAVDRATADSVVAGLESALAARSRIDAHAFAFRELHAMHGRPARAPAGPYLAVPVGVTAPLRPGSDLGDVQLFALVVGPDRAVLSAAGRMPQPPGASRPHHDPWGDLPDVSEMTVTDDGGHSYEIGYNGSSSDDEGRWSALLSVSPVPPAGTRWLDLAMGSGAPAIRMDLADHAGDDHAARGPVPVGSPAERLVDAAAESLLEVAARELGDVAWCHDLSDIADVVTALDAAGALGPARGAVGRLVALAERLGVPVPPALAAAAPGPQAELPVAWQSVLENRGRADGPRGVAAAAAVLPEIDGARFTLAGLRSDGAGAELQVLGWGWGHMPDFLEPAQDGQWSWSARDDQGRWHVLSEGSGSYGGDHADLELRLVPALHPDAMSLDVMLAGPSGQVSVTVPLDWWERQ